MQIAVLISRPLIFALIIALLVLAVVEALLAGLEIKRFLLDKKIEKLKEEAKDIRGEE